MSITLNSGAYLPGSVKMDLFSFVNV